MTENEWALLQEQMWLLEDEEYTEEEWLIEHES